MTWGGGSYYLGRRYLLLTFAAGMVSYIDGENVFVSITFRYIDLNNMVAKYQKQISCYPSF